MVCRATTVSCLAVSCLLPGVGQARAQEPAAKTEQAGDSKTMFGVLPNYLTADGKPGEHPMTAGQKFTAASQNTFAPIVYPLVGMMSATHMTYGRGVEGYGKQYAASFAVKNLNPANDAIEFANVDSGKTTYHPNVVLDLDFYVYVPGRAG